MKFTEFPMKKIPREFPVYAMKKPREFPVCLKFMKFPEFTMKTPQGIPCMQAILMFLVCKAGYTQ